MQKMREITEDLERTGLCVYLSTKLEDATEDDAHARYSSSGVAFVLARLMELGRVPTSGDTVISYERLRDQARQLSQSDYDSPLEAYMAKETRELMMMGIFTNLHALGMSDGHSCDLVI